ncbi:MAG: GNAT family N-acetyltransferase [Pseudomonadota bacterium]
MTKATEGDGPGRPGLRERRPFRAMTLEILARPVDHPDALAMIAGSETELASLYKPEHRNALDPQELIDAGVTFVVCYCDGAPIGCGGYAPFDGFAELKRIYVADAARGAGIGAAIVHNLEGRARATGYALMRLETGEASPDALALYAKLGYARIGPFGHYVDNGSSVFMERAL